MDRLISALPLTTRLQPRAGAETEQQQAQARRFLAANAALEPRVYYSHQTFARFEAIYTTARSSLLVPPVAVEARAAAKGTVRISDVSFHSLALTVACWHALCPKLSSITTS